MSRLVVSIFLLTAISLSSIQSQVNYDESKIKTYEVPDPLIGPSGNSIANAEEWVNSQRPYLHKLLQKEVYGKFPDENIKVSFKLRSTHALESIPAILKNVDIIISNGAKSIIVDLAIFLPAQKKNVPVFVGLNFFGNHTVHSSTDLAITQSWSMNRNEFGITNNKASATSRGVRKNRWPIENIIKRGYGLAVMYYGDIDPDFSDGFENGIHSLLSPSQKQISEGISAISAWSYGLSKAMDYFESDKDIDQDRVAVIGHSRLGKTSLWAGAHDQRFAMVISNNSGCGGAALSRRKIGETVKIINTNFPHWFSKNYRKVIDKEEEQDFDQHMLLSLIAPRPIYVASAVDDKWADPIGEFLSLYHARNVYKLYGDETFEVKNMPYRDQPFMKGNMAYHVRSGKHDLTKYDWEKYMDFADKVLKE